MAIGVVAFFLHTTPFRKLPKYLGKTTFKAHETIVKQRVLFHASPHKNLTHLKPMALTYRGKNEGAAVFATPHIDFAAMFLTRAVDSWALKGSVDNGPFYFICKDKKRFMEESQKGGAIYCCDAQNFHTDLTKGNKSQEWLSRKPVKILTSLLFDSSFDAMLQLGVQVFFIDEKTFAALSTTIKKTRNMVKEREILMSLVSENKKLKRNYKPLFNYQAWNQHVKKQGLV